MQPFRAGIGLLAQESRTALLPVALGGMDVLVARLRRWFHAGLVEVRVDSPVLPQPGESSADLTKRLEVGMQRLLEAGSDGLPPPAHNS